MFVCLLVSWFTLDSHHDFRAITKAFRRPLLHTLLSDNIEIILHLEPLFRFIDRSLAIDHTKPMDTRQTIRQLEESQRTLLRKRKSIKDTLESLQSQGRSLGLARLTQDLPAFPAPQETGRLGRQQACGSKQRFGQSESSVGDQLT